MIKENIDPGGEITSVPVYQELFKTAQLFGVDSTEARTAVLYPGKESLESSVREGVLQRLLAAWFFIMSWYEDKQIINEDLLFKNTESIALNLLDLLKEIESDPDKADTGKINVSVLRKNVYRTLTSYRRQREGLVQVKRLKEYAKASKDEGEYEDAIMDLEKAVELLLPVYKRIGDNNYKISISQEIADCYGMMGGYIVVRRREMEIEFILKNLLKCIKKV